MVFSPAESGDGYLTSTKKRRRLARDSSATTSTRSLSSSTDDQKLHGSAAISSSEQGSFAGSDADTDIDESILKVFDMPTVEEQALTPPVPPEHESSNPISIEILMGNDTNGAWVEKGENVSDLVLDDFNARDFLAEWGI
jgi:hypothetical protein